MPYNTLTGTQVNYYFICKRKLWLHSHGISFENSSDLVKLGNQIHKNTYKRNKKEIRLDNIVIDHIDGDVIHEVKKSDKMQEAHIYQVLYYIYRLKQMGIYVTGKLDYPKLRKTVKIILTKQKQNKLEQIIEECNNIFSTKKAPKAKYIPVCDKCAYFEYCWS